MLLNVSNYEKILSEINKLKVLGTGGAALIHNNKKSYIWWFNHRRNTQFNLCNLFHFVYYQKINPLIKK